MFAVAERQAFPECRFINLDDPDTGLFQIGDLVAQREGNLPAHIRPRDIVAHEGPLLHGHRPREHALHRPDSK